MYHLFLGITLWLILICFIAWHFGTWLSRRRYYEGWSTSRCLLLSLGFIVITFLAPQIFVPYLIEWDKQAQRVQPPALQRDAVDVHPNDGGGDPNGPGSPPAPGESLAPDHDGHRPESTPPLRNPA